MSEDARIAPARLSAALRLVQGEALGHDAVRRIGPGKRMRPRLLSEGWREGAVGSRAEQPFLERRIAMPMLERVFGATYEDMRRMEALLSGSDLDWVCLRPPRLVNKRPTGQYRLDAGRPLPKARSLTYGDLATALLDTLDREDLYRQTAFVAN